MHYAGIGSRETPLSTRNLMTAVARRLSRLGYTLRSGGADGADSAFRAGADRSWIFYKDHALRLSPEGDEKIEYNAEDILFMEGFVTKYHPVPHALKGGGRELMRRNTLQVMNYSQHWLEVPRVDFVLCWTPDGSLDGANRSAGGTGQALRISRHHGIPVFNLEPDAPAALNRLAALLRELGVVKDGLPRVSADQILDLGPRMAFIHATRDPEARVIFPAVEAVADGVKYRFASRELFVRSWKRTHGQAPIPPIEEVDVEVGHQNSRRIIFDVIHL
jgi:hypothetical protein